MNPVKALKKPPLPEPLSLKEWLIRQEGLHFPMVGLGLQRCREVAARLGLLDPQYRIITVAGTNGKGSSVAMLESVLRRADYATGAYYSPHLLRYNERIRINGLEAGEAELCDAFQRIDEARGATRLTYFEFGTLAAFYLFREAAVQVGILEVGLGGRLDAVNLLDPDLALVTSIDLDHQRWLGADRTQISLEKAGIFRNGRAAVCSDADPPGALLRRASEMGVTLSLFSKDYHVGNGGDSWDWHGPDNTHHLELPQPDPMNLCQLQNAGGVLMALHCLRDCLPVEEQALRKGLAEVRFPGRFQVLPGRPCYILDVAHNQQAARQLRRNLESLPRVVPQHFLIGMLADKDYASVLRILAPLAASLHLVDLPPPRGAPAAWLATALGDMGARLPRTHCYPDIDQALASLRREAREGDRIVICGSFLTVGGAMKHLGAVEFK